MNMYRDTQKLNNFMLYFTKNIIFAMVFFLFIIKKYFFIKPIKRFFVTLIGYPKSESKYRIVILTFDTIHCIVHNVSRYNRTAMNISPLLFCTITISYLSFRTYHGVKPVDSITIVSFSTVVYYLFIPWCIDTVLYQKLCMPIVARSYHIGDLMLNWRTTKSLVVHIKLYIYVIVID